MVPQDPLLSLLQAQGVTGLFDAEGGFQIDREALKDHYGSMLENDLEAVSFFLQSARRWQALKVDSKTSGTLLQMDIELPEDSLLKDRLSPEPGRRLEAFFPKDHPLYELAQGFNILTYSELTKSMALYFDGDTLSLRWEFHGERFAKLLSALSPTQRGEFLRL